MRKELLGCLSGLLATAGLAWAEPPAPTAAPLPGPEIMSPVMTAPTSAGDWGAGNPDGSCGPPGRFWIDGEYLLWWFRGDAVPPLLTTGPAVLPSPGALGQPGTSVLYGGNRIDENPHSGFRITGGMWLDDCNKKGIEGYYLYLAPASNNATFSSPGSPILARPFFDVVGNPALGIPPGSSSEVLTFPGIAAGSANIHHGSQMQGAGLNFLCNVCCCCNARFDLLAGFAWLDLKERLSVNEGFTLLAPVGALLPGDTVSIFDQFDTRNRFYGGTIGARTEVWNNRLFARVTGTLGLGVNHQEVNINGATTTTASGVTTVAEGGLLALPSNIGSYARNRFSVVPQIDVKTGVVFADNHLRLFVGYTFLYWSNVARPGEQIDLALNPNLVPNNVVAPGGPQRPAPLLTDSGFWAQGVNFGVELRF